MNIIFFNSFAWRVSDVPEKTPKSQADKEHQLAVFISYSHHDIVAADQIVASLESNGFNVLIDRRDLPYGEKWQNELSGFIASSDTVIWLVSPTSIISKWCNWELDEVNKHNKRLVPVRVGDVTPEDLPRQLGEIHILPARDLFDVSAHMSVLATTLETDRPWLKEHSRLSERARQWIKRNKTEASLLRGRALNDAEKWQNAQPPKAPAPSHDVFNLILSSRQATIKRHRRMVTGSVTGMVLALGLAGAALWQWDLAKKQSQRVIKVSSLSGWQAFEKPKAACLAMREYTGEEGLRALYCHIRDVFSYQKIEELAGIPIFNSGPHQNYKLRVQENSFGYYNPEFLKWAQKKLLPKKNDAIYIGATKPLYDKFVRNMARAYHRSYVQWSHNLGHFEKERRYLTAMIEGKRSWSYLGGRWQNDTIKSILGMDVEGEKLNWYHVDTALRFWQRRSIDGTSDEFFASLEALLAVYDPDFIRTANRPAGKAPHLPPPGAIADPVLDPQKPWLPEPTGDNIILNDVVVIE